MIITFHPQTVEKEWVSPIQRKVLNQVQRDKKPEEDLRSGNAYLFYNGYNTHAHCFTKLKERARSG